MEITQRDDVTKSDDVEVVPFSSSRDAMRLQLLEMAGRDEAPEHWAPARRRRARRTDTRSLAPTRKQVYLAARLLRENGMPFVRLHRMSRHDVARIIGGLTR